MTLGGETQRGRERKRGGVGGGGGERERERVVIVLQGGMHVPTINGKINVISWGGRGLTLTSTTNRYESSL